MISVGDITPTLASLHSLAGAGQLSSISDQMPNSYAGAVS